jgi:hypothetical protein
MTVGDLGNHFVNIADIVLKYNKIRTADHLGRGIGFKQWSLSRLICLE